ncbi:MAG TPA: carbonic anhydrase [Ktedonobacterales bacterium]|nr:carbonic anhydrase [Ktedonobacterales bacterium]
MSVDSRRLLEGNARYAESFRDGGLHHAPAERLVILTCMDARIEPVAALGLRLGDAHVLRNAGGRVCEDVLRSVALSQQLLGTTTIAVIHHTHCGMAGLSNRGFREEIERRERTQEIGRGAHRAARQIDFLPFSDLDASVREDIGKLQASPLLRPGTSIFGFVFDVKTGILRAV